MEDLYVFSSSLAPCWARARYRLSAQTFNHGPMSTFKRAESAIVLIVLIVLIVFIVLIVLIVLTVCGRQSTNWITHVLYLSILTDSTPTTYHSDARQPIGYSLCSTFLPRLWSIDHVFHPSSSSRSRSNSSWSRSFTIQCTSRVRAVATKCLSTPPARDRLEQGTRYLSKFADRHSTTRHTTT